MTIPTPDVEDVPSGGKVVDSSVWSVCSGGKASGGCASIMNVSPLNGIHSISMALKNIIRCI